MDGIDTEVSAGLRTVNGSRNKIGYDSIYESVVGDNVIISDDASDDDNKSYSNENITKKSSLRRPPK
jgi:hypothetical protein